MDFTTRTLGEISDEVGGIIQCGPFGSQLHKSDYRDEGVPVIMPKNIIEGKVSIDDITRIGSKDVTRLQQHVMREGEIIYGRRGDIGRRALITKREIGWFCGTGCLRISLGASVIEPSFLYYYLGQPRVMKWVANQAVGATLPNLNTDIIRSIPITYPNHIVQRKIAAVLTAYDDLVENNNRRIRILEEMTQSIYREWFVSFRFPGHEKVKMVDSPFGEIPDGWKTVKLRDICESVDYGFTASARNEAVGPKFLRITDIVPNTISWESVPYCEIPEEKVPRYLLKEGDIVIARIGATAGYAKRIRKRHPLAIFASYLVRVRLSISYAGYFVGIFVESDDYKQFIKRNIGGAAQPQANAQVLTSVSTVLPPEDLLCHFNNLIQDIYDEIEVLQNKCSILRKTRDLLLPKLIAGEIDVSELRIDNGKVIA